MRYLAGATMMRFRRPATIRSEESLDEKILSSDNSGFANHRRSRIQAPECLPAGIRQLKPGCVSTTLSPDLPARWIFSSFIFGPQYRRC